MTIDQHAVAHAGLVPHSHPHELLGTDDLPVLGGLAFFSALVLLLFWGKQKRWLRPR